MNQKTASRWFPWVYSQGRSPGHANAPGDNTTKHAARLAAALADLPGTYHLSARMCPVHRLEKLADIKARLLVDYSPVTGLLRQDANGDVLQEIG